MSVNDMMAMVQNLQRSFHDRIAYDINALHDGGSASAFITLIVAGFLYGVFHAVGPGHGKVVISGYMLADDHTLKRGLIITALSSLMQAVVAVTLILVLFYGLNFAREKTEYAAAWLESVSFVLVALVGAVLLVRGFKDLVGRRHVHGPHCNHGHAPDAASVKSIHSPLAIATMVASIGIRPCSGALLLMIFACLLEEVWAGIAATFAMAVGTAITTSLIAVAAATSRKGILKALGQSERRIAILSAILKIIGGLLIVSLGAVFFFAGLPNQSSETIAPYNHPLMGHRE